MRSSAAAPVNSPAVFIINIAESNFRHTQDCGMVWLRGHATVADKGYATEGEFVLI